MKSSLLFLALIFVSTSLLADIYSSVLEKFGTEPEYELTKYYDFSMSLEDIENNMTYLVEKHPEHLKNKDWMKVYSFNVVRSKSGVFFRMIFSYRYDNVETEHGSPSQKFIIWEDLTTDEKQVYITDSSWPI